MQKYGQIIKFILQYLNVIVCVLLKTADSESLQKYHKKSLEYIEVLEKKTVKTYREAPENQLEELETIKNGYTGNKYLLDQFISLFKAQNKNNKISVTREIFLIQTILTAIKDEGLSYVQMESGLNICIEKNIPNINYAKRVAIGIKEKQEKDGKVNTFLFNANNKVKTLMDEIWEDRNQND